MQQPHAFLAARSGAPPSSLRWVASLLYLGVLSAGLYTHAAGICVRQADPGRLALFVGTLGLLLALERIGRHHNLHAATRLAVGLLAVRIAAFELVSWADCSGLSRTLFLLIPFIAYFCLGKRAAYALAALYLGALLVRLMVADAGWYLDREALSDVLMFFIGLVFTISMAGVASVAEANRARAAQLLDELAASHQQLTAYAQRSAELGAAEERNRLARDIHDSLGHYLTAIHVLLDKAIAYRQRDPAEADQAIWDAKRSARQALQDVRQSVSALRHTEDGFSLAASLAELVQAMRSPQLVVDVQISGAEANVSKLALITLYRAAQEGFTNIQKHARASRVTLRVTLGEQESRLVITDDGCGFEPTSLAALPINRSERFGLQGLRERLELVGGTLSLASSETAGTQLTVSIPQRQSAFARVAPSSEVLA